MAVLDLVDRHPDDAGVLRGLREHGIPPAAEAWFDAPAVEDEMKTGTSLRVRRRDELEALARSRCTPRRGSSRSRSEPRDRCS